MTLLEEIRPTWLEIDLDRLKYNMKSVRDYVDRDVKILAVVKANSYGHGAVECAPVFLENGADMLGVATLVEAIELRRAEIDAPILILGYTQDSELHKVIEYDITPMVFTYEQARILSEEARKMNKTCKLHIKIDTGMSRLGFSINEENIEIIRGISRLEGVFIEGIYSHFLQSDIRDKTITKEQFKRFIWLSDRLREKGVNIPIRHISNSASALDNPEHNLEMVRVGQMIYGIYSSDQVKKSNIDLKFASSFKTRISDYRTIEEGDFVGYSQGFIADRKMKVAALAVGYADGYTKEMSQLVGAEYKGKRISILGNICMDQCMVDISGIDDVRRNDIVSLYGYEDGEMRAQLIARIARRVPRVYISGGRPISVVDYLL